MNTIQTHHKQSFGIIALMLLCLFLISELNSSIIAVYPDAYAFIWNFWWADYARVHSLPFFDSKMIFSPNGSSLVLHTFTPAYSIGLAYLAPFISPVSKYNLVTLLCFVGNFLSMKFFLKEIYLLNNPEIERNNKLAITVLSLSFTIHPYFIGHLMGGHLNLISAFPLLCSAGFWLRLNRPNSRSLVNATSLVLSLLLLFYVSLNYFYFFCLLTPFLCLSQKHLNSKLLILIAALTISVSLLTPSIFSIQRSFQTENFTANHSPRLHSADLLNLALPGSFQLLKDPFISRLSLNSAEAGSYLGWGLLTSLLVGLIKLRKTWTFTIWFLASLFFGLLILGPRITFAGHSILNVNLYSFFNQALPSFPSVPARFGIITIICLLACLTVLITKSNKRLPLILALIIFVEYLPDPSLFGKLQTIETSSALEQLKSDKSILAIYDTSDQHIAMLNQTFHEKAINHAFLARQEKINVRFNLQNNFTRYLFTKRKLAPEKILSGFKLFKSQGVLALKENQPILSKLTALPWLNRTYEDEKQIFFKYTGRN